MSQDVIKTLAKPKTKKRFIVNLLTDKRGALPVVRSCEVAGDTYRNRTSFQARYSIEDVFEDQVAEGIRHCLDALDPGSKVLHLPDFMIEAPELMLGGANVMVTEKEAGEVAIILRFTLLIGSVGAAFRPEFSVPDTVTDAQHRVAALVLSDISLPLLNLCAAAETGLLDSGANLGQFAARLAEKSDEIRFQIELVKRYVDSLDRNPNDGAQTKHLLPKQAAIPLEDAFAHCA